MSGHRILVVEDTAIVRRTLCDFLRQQGYEIAEAASAADAVPMQQAFGPDCIVADYSLSDGDALSLLPRFKRGVVDHEDVDPRTGQTLLHAAKNPAVLHGRRAQARLGEGAGPAGALSSSPATRK